MENVLSPYECQFNAEERKAIVAQVLQELRKSKGYSQKEVAAFINVKVPTYSTYENGRTEAPIEVLVRLSYLYGVSMDVITQKDRLYKTSVDVQKQIDEYRAQIERMKEMLLKNGGSNPMVEQMIQQSEKILQQMELANQNQSIKDQINAFQANNV